MGELLKFWQETTRYHSPTHTDRENYQEKFKQLRARLQSRYSKEELKEACRKYQADA